MRIDMSCSGGTLRVFHLASRLNRHNVLGDFYVPYYSRQYPFLRRFFGNPDDNQIIDYAHVKQDLGAVFIHTLIRKAKLDKHFRFENRLVTCNLIDRAVARRLRPGADIVMAESLMALSTLQKAKSFGAVTILDRPNSHIENQSQLLEEEYQKWGIEKKYNSRETIAKSMQEYEQVDYIAVLSSFVRRTFLAKGIPAEKLLLIPSGVNLDDFKPQPKDNENVFRIIFCGYLCFKKGVQYLLEAYSQLKLKNSELWLIGSVESEFEPMLKKYSGQFKYFKHIPHMQMAQFMSQGSVLVLPSLEEGLAKVMMEAMACGLPVIATPNTGAEDIFQDQKEGFIIPMRNVDVLKERIEALYRDPQLRKNMGDKARLKVADGFTFDDYARRYQEACASVLKKKIG